jgi:hypothetical protein
MDLKAVSLSNVLNNVALNIWDVDENPHSVLLALLPYLAVRELPTQNKLNVLSPTTRARHRSRSHPLVTTLPTVAKHIVAIGFSEAALPFSVLRWRE